MATNPSSEELTTKPSSEEMELLYDMLRQMTADELRQFKNEAVVKYLMTGDSNYALMAYQCIETCSRWTAGKWKYHH